MTFCQLRSSVTIERTTDSGVSVQSDTRSKSSVRYNSHHVAGWSHPDKARTAAVTRRFLFRRLPGVRFTQHAAAAKPGPHAPEPVEAGGLGAAVAALPGRHRK
jgi:hypothetical protein